MPKSATLWDNSNIAESYAGVTTPLTISFAKLVYQVVYIQVAKASGLSQKKIDQKTDIFKNLVDSKFGCLYYNLLNWYQFTSLFPGYGKNIQNLERMLSIPEFGGKITAEKPSTLLKLYYPSLIVFRYLTFCLQIDRFIREVNSVICSFQLNPLPKENKKLWKIFKNLTKRLLPKWHIPVDNDFLVMTYSGLLEKVIQPALRKSPDLFQKLLSETKTTLSSQVWQLKDLLSFINSDQIAQKLLISKKDLQLEKYLSENSDSKIGKSYSQYINQFGARLPSELKLESPSIKENPKQLFDVLRLYNQGFLQKKNKLEANILCNLSWPRKLFIKFLYSKLNRHLAYREKTRLLRARMFEIVRQLLITIAKELQGQKVLSNYRDIFFLTLSEIEHIINRKISINKIRFLIEKRKNEFKKNQKVEAPSRFWEKEGRIQSLDNKPSVSDTRWEGVGTARGRVRGRAVVLIEPDLARIRSGDILVTKHTDPGWTPLFTIIGGIIVERGGMLSHASVVAREYGIPCITQISGISSKLKTGQQIEMDGLKGRVEVIK